uniref:GNAT family N-acetyltransferase n=1 Tax=Candidatus Methanomethylicus mesodigestus TaxID=1867258 RepID=A0A7C3FBH3_9CREN
MHETKPTPPVFKIEPAAEKDWPWILGCMAEIAKESLGPGLDSASEDMIMRSVNLQADNIRGPKGFPNQAFIAKGKDGDNIGYIWMAETKEEFTSLPQAFVLDMYVKSEFRRLGVGKSLMKFAEAWALDRGLTRIALSVASGNEAAKRLYESLGYRTEAQRMAKPLEKRPPP